MSSMHFQTLLNSKASSRWKRSVYSWLLLLSSITKRLKDYEMSALLEAMSNQRRNCEHQQSQYCNYASWQNSGNKTNEWEKSQNGRSPKMGEVPMRLRHVHSCIRRSCQKSSEAIGENGQQAKPIHTAARLLIPENSKSPDTPMTQVTKGQSGWGFTVKHGATSQHRPQSAVLRSEPLVCQ